MQSLLAVWADLSASPDDDECERMLLIAIAARLAENGGCTELQVAEILYRMSKE